VYLSSFHNASKVSCIKALSVQDTKENQSDVKIDPKEKKKKLLTAK
jgi:hypothetical protein